MKSNKMFPRSLAVLFVVTCQSVTALEADRGQPVYMEADGVEIDEKSGASVYQGNVILTQGSIRITAETVEIQQKAEGDKGRIEASGNPVTFSQETDDGKTIRGRASQIEYDTDDELLVMIGDAELEQGKDTFSSDRIIYDRARAVVKAGASAKGKQRVRMTIQPNKK